MPQSPKKAPPKKPNPTGARPKLLDRERQPLPDMYYDQTSGRYFVKAADGSFIYESQQNLTVRLMVAGYSNERSKGLASEVDERLLDVRNRNTVDYAAPLAGWAVGCETMAGNQVLVTKATTYPLATFGKDTFIKDYIERMLGHDQAQYMHDWLAIGREELFAANLRRGQVMVLAGEQNHGKSLFAKKVMVPIFGGRHASPHQAMTGGTTFNKDWFGSEVMLIDDQGGEDAYVTRQAFKVAIKMMVGSDDARCHAKGKDALILFPFWRMLICLNDELEDLQVLPTMRGLEHKIIILKTVSHGADFGVEDYSDLAAKFEAGLSDYLGWLERRPIRATGKTPAEVKLASRFGMLAWQNPEILEMLNELSPEETLSHLIKEGILAGVEVPIEMEAREISCALLDEGSPTHAEASRLLRSTMSLGKFLSRMHSTHPELVEKLKRSAGHPHRYRLYPPGVKRVSKLALLRRDSSLREKAPGV